MSKNKNRSNDGEQTTEATSAAGEAQSAVTGETAAPAVSTGPNYTLRFKRNHPQNRASYGIAGVAGIVVVQRDLVAGTTVPTSNEDLAGMPATITVDALLVSPKADNKEQKALAAAAKAQEKADKAKAKAEEQQRKIAEKAEKAKAALEAAQAKVAAASKPADAPAGESTDAVENL